MEPRNILNLAVLAHVDAGKTTLTEQFLYHSGTIRRAGSVDNGSAQTDRLEIERNRGISVKATEASFTYGGVRINLIDTPGHSDFAGEVERALLAPDAALLIVSAVEGIQSHTERLWNALRKLSIPTVIFLNKIDRAGSRTKEILSEMPERLAMVGVTLLPMVEAVGEGSDGFAIATPADLADRATEAAAELCDDIALAYLEGEAVNPDLLEATLRQGVRGQKILPVYCGAAQKGLGVGEVLDGLLRFLPRASERSTDELSGLVYAIEHDKTMGKVARVRLFGGTLAARDALSLNDGVLSLSETGEKISQIRITEGARFRDSGVASAGEIAALCGLSTAKVYQTIGSYRLPDRLRLALPYLQVKATPETEEQLPALLKALTQLSDEDPLLACRFSKAEREILLSITGKIQLEVLTSLLWERYQLRANFSAPTIIYKETPSKTGYGFDAYTMPKPCWAVVKFLIEPLPQGSGLVYDGGHVPNNKLFYRYQTHIEQSVKASLSQGMLGWEVTDLKITLADGEHHTIHTHPLDFFVATPMALMDGLRNTGTTLLEPILRVKIRAGEDFLGKILSDITRMRGEFDSPVIGGTAFTLEALIPAATSLEFPLRIASLTHGTALYSSDLAYYKPCPLELGATTPRRGPSPLDRSKWILYARGAMTDENYQLM
ncbi:MAG: TetM/TetW/TetO/TetS family tetracycline resistance ribosomal protection protein [Clostridia bacterium]|nr:TetM/TetW/TetO/TetS family tetracycline resistance ribosomal protection protein [Clostridia bacterium]